LKSKLPFTILTETNLVADFTHDFEKELKKYDILPFLAEEGVLILLKKGPKIINFERSRRLVTLIIDSEEHGKIRIIGIYVPASQQERNEFLPSLESIPSLPGVKTIIGGDFNFVECQDRTSKYNPKSANLWRLSVAHLNLMMKQQRRQQKRLLNIGHPDIQPWTWVDTC
jgi:exonuclease III